MEEEKQNKEKILNKKIVYVIIFKEQKKDGVIWNF